MVCQFHIGATRENRTFFAISGWLVKKWRNWASIGLLWANGEGRLSPLGNTGDVPRHFQAFCLEFYLSNVRKLFSKNQLIYEVVINQTPFNDLWRPPTALEAGQSTQNSQDMIYHFRNGATRENRTIFATSGWLVKKCLNRARIDPLWAAGHGRISPLGNTWDLPRHFQALCWDFYVVKIKVRDVQK